VASNEGGRAALPVTCALLAAFLGVTGRVGTALAAERACDQSEQALTPSPGGRWEASVQHQVCETAGGGVAAAVTVYVGAPGAALQGERVAAIAVPRTREEWPRVVWRGESSLEVWVPNFAQVLATGSPRDLAVTLRYCADDPEARELVARHQLDLQEWMKAVSRWNELRKSNPDTAGARPVRPSEPKVDRRACRDSDIPR
jgi:hypothetical protein